MRKTILSGLLAALLASPVAAQEVDEIIVSATGIPTPASQIGASVDVITAEDLEQQQIIYLQDALKLKGINVGQNGGPGTSANLFLRGLPSKHTMLVMDDIPIVDPQLDYPYWADVSSEGVGRIEILRGPQGVLYGSNTIAGVISQYTDIGGERVSKARVELGKFGTRRLAYTNKGSEGKVDFGFGVSRLHSDGFSAAKKPAGNTSEFDDDSYDNTTFNAKVRTHLSETVYLDAVMRHSEGKVDTDSGAGRDATGRWTEFDRTTGRLALVWDTGFVSHRVGVTTYDNDTSIFQDNELTSYGADTQRETADYRGLFSISDGLRIIFGLNANQSNDGSNEVDTNSLYSLIQYSVSDDMTFTGAVRSDDHDLFGSHETYRATLSYMLSENILLRASHGTGFRAPSLDELYSPYSGGNENFKPAHSESTEFGAEINLSNGLEVKATTFIAEIEDAIDYSFTVGGPYGSYQQFSGTTEVSGLELEMSLPVSTSLELVLDAVYTDSKKPANDGSNRLERQGRVPRVQAGLSADFAASESLSVSLGARYVKGAVENIGGNLTEFDDYTVWDIRAAYKINERVTAYGRIENALDEDYETALGYSTPGRAAYIGLTTKF